MISVEYSFSQTIYIIMSAIGFRSIQKAKDLLRCYSIHSLYEHPNLNRLFLSLRQTMLELSRKNPCPFTLFVVSHEMPSERENSTKVFHLICVCQEENYKSNLIFAGMIFFIVSGMVQCFGFRRKIMLITNQCFSCWVELAWSQGLSAPHIELLLRRLSMHKKLWGDTVKAADPTWPKDFFILNDSTIKLGRVGWGSSHCWGVGWASVGWWWAIVPCISCFAYSFC